MIPEFRRAALRAAAPARVPTLLRGLGWISILYGAAKAATLLTQVAAGRWLGPAEFGRANLALAAAAYLQIATVLGFPVAIAKFLSAETEEDARARLVGTALSLFALWSMFCLPLLWAARGAIERVLGLDDALLGAALLVAAANSIYVVAASPLLGLKNFFRRGLAEIVYGFFTLPTLFALSAFLGRDYRALVWAMTTGFGAGTLYALWAQRRYLAAAFQPRALADLSRYAGLASLNLLAAACVLAPARLLLHARGDDRAVGVFSAYFTATIQAALALTYMIQSVVVPMAGDEAGQRETWALIKRRGPAATFAAWGLFAAALAAALAVFGGRYPWRADWAAEFSLAAALALAHGTLSALFSARDMGGLRVSVIGGLIAGLADVVLAARWIPSHGIGGAAGALLAAYALGLAFFVSVRALTGARAAAAA